MAAVSNVAEGMSLREFLETVPPGRAVSLAATNFKVQAGNKADIAFSLNAVPIMLHCGTAACGGMRVFEPTEDGIIIGWRVRDRFLYYACRNCKSTLKAYSLRFNAPEGNAHSRISRSVARSLRLDHRFPQNSCSSPETSC